MPLTCRKPPLLLYARKTLTDEHEILSRWTEYCLDLYTHTTCADNVVEKSVLDCSQFQRDLQPIFREGVNIAVAAQKTGNLPELIIYHQNFFKLAGSI